MIEHVWTVLCSKSIIDSVTNNISLMEVVEQINAQGPPLEEDQQGLIPVDCQLVSFWSRATDGVPCRGEVRLQLVSPSGVVLNEQTYEVDLSSYERNRTRARIQGLPIRQFGRHTFVVFVRETGGEWREVAKIPMIVNLIAEEAPAAAQPN